MQPAVPMRPEARRILRVGASGTFREQMCQFSVKETLLSIAMPEPTPLPIVVPPALWDGDASAEAVLTEWYAEDGATVAAGDRLAEIMVDKVTMELDAFEGGVLEIRVAANEHVTPGTTIAVLHRR